MKPVYVVIVAVVVAAGAFFGGMKYQQSKAVSNLQGFAGRNGNGQTRNGGNGGFRPVVGSVVSVDDKSITVKMQDNSTKIVVISDSTKITKTQDGAKSDLKVGDNVGVFGTSNSDGSVTAQNIQLNPMFQQRGTQGTTNN